MVVSAHFYYGCLGTELYFDWSSILHYPLLQQYAGISTYIGHTCYFPSEFKKIVTCTLIAGQWVRKQVPAKTDSW
jgi:hypothetical protein